MSDENRNRSDDQPLYGKENYACPTCGDVKDKYEFDRREFTPRSRNDAPPHTCDPTAPDQLDELLACAGCQDDRIRCTRNRPEAQPLSHGERCGWDPNRVARGGQPDASLVSYARAVATSHGRVCKHCGVPDGSAGPCGEAGHEHAWIDDRRRAPTLAEVQAMRSDKAKRGDDSSSQQVVNHDEAYQLACMKQGESNLARCYLALRDGDDRCCLVESRRDDCPVHGIGFSAERTRLAGLTSSPETASEPLFDEDGEPPTWPGEGIDLQYDSGYRDGYRKAVERFRVSRLLDEVGMAIADVEARGNAEDARECLRAVAKIRTRWLGRESPKPDAVDRSFDAVEREYRESSNARQAFDAVAIWNAALERAADFVMDLPTNEVGYPTGGRSWIADSIRKLEPPASPRTGHSEGATAKVTEHVCGLRGFGALGDVCPACREDASR